MLEGVTHSGLAFGCAWDGLSPLQHLQSHSQQILQRQTPKSSAKSCHLCDICIQHIQINLLLLKKIVLRDAIFVTSAYNTYNFFNCIYVELNSEPSALMYNLSQPLSYLCFRVFFRLCIFVFFFFLRIGVVSWLSLGTGCFIKSSQYTLINHHRAIPLTTKAH